MKKLFTLILFTLAFCVSCMAANAQTLTVTGSYANCRRFARQDSECWGRVYKGETYEILGSDVAPNGKRWYRIQQKSGKGGYICSSFVRLNGTAVKAASSSGRRYLGNYKITGYCYYCNSPKNSYATSSGRKATAGRTVAIRGVKTGTRVYIDGLGERIVEDGGCDSGVCDVFCARHADESPITGWRDVWILI